MPDQSGPKFIIDEIMPVRQMHLIAGPSGAGKTTLLFQILQSIQLGEPIFGHKSYSVPFVYVSCDRSIEGVHATLDRVNVAHGAFPILAGVEGAFKSAENVLNLVVKTHPETRLVVLEGLAMLTEDKTRDSDYAAIGKWLRNIVRLCVSMNLTVLGVVHSPKMKERDRYTNPRQRVHGTVAWAAICDMIVLIEPSDEKDVESPSRDVFVLPRNSREFKIEMMIDENGRLVEPDAGANQTWIKRWIAKQPPTKIWTTQEVVEAGENDTIPLSESTVKRWLQWASSTGYCEKVSRGHYRSKLMI